MMASGQIMSGFLPNTQIPTVIGPPLSGRISTRRRLRRFATALPRLLLQARQITPTTILTFARANVNMVVGTWIGHDYQQSFAARIANAKILQANGSTRLEEKRFCASS